MQKRQAVIAAASAVLVLGGVGVAYAVADNDTPPSSVQIRSELAEPEPVVTTLEPAVAATVPEVTSPVDPPGPTGPAATSPPVGPEPTVPPATSPPAPEPRSVSGPIYFPPDGPPQTVPVFEPPPPPPPPGP